MKIKRLIVFIIVSALLITFMIKISGKIKKSADNFAQNEIKKTVSSIIENTVLNYIYEKKVRYSDFCISEYDSNGKLQFIKIDSVKLNILKSEILIAVNNMLGNENICSFSVPLGNIFGSELTSGMGPKIKIKAVPLGYAAGKISGDLQNGGINQTLHRLILKINASVSFAYPFTNTECDISSEICIAETVIIGSVPNIYYGRSH